MMSADGDERPSNQSIIVSGESGAGKTFSSSLMLGYLSRLSRCRAAMSVAMSVEDKVERVSPILEAFGNAKTQRNDNSSRFGKFLKIKYRQGRIVGAEMKHYLLEKSRVTHHPRRAPPPRAPQVQRSPRVGGRGRPRLVELLATMPQCRDVTMSRCHVPP